MYNVDDSVRYIWRRKAELNLKGTTLSPVYDPEMHPKDVVRNDLKMIDGCNTVLAYLPFESAGSSMEIFYAYRAGKRVYVVAPHFKINPWISAHCHRSYISLDRCINALNSTSNF